MSIVRLFNEPEGWNYLRKQGIRQDFLPSLPLLGISGIGNLLGAIKFAKYFELTKRDIVVTVLTDSMDLYKTRVEEMRESQGAYSDLEAAKDYHRYLMGASTGHMLELSYYDKRRIHNLKYFTWIEQQGKSLAELDAQWYDYPEYWDRIHRQADQIDRLIEQFNDRAGLLKR